MRAVQMLVKASNQGMIDPRSISMIILVSDGDPTVGKTNTPDTTDRTARISRTNMNRLSNVISHR